MRSSCDGVDLVDVGERPAQVLDRIFLVDRLDLVEEPVNRVVQLRVHVERQAGLGNLHRHAAPQRELFGFRIGLEREHRIVQRRVDAFPEDDVVDELVALVQLHLGDLRDRAVHLLRAAGGGAADAEHADVETALRLPLLENLQHIGVAARRRRTS